MIHEGLTCRVHIAVISHKRPENMAKIFAITGPCTFYVNRGEGRVYKEQLSLKPTDIFNSHNVKIVECGEDICSARNQAIMDARKAKADSIQVSDDLKNLKRVYIEGGVRKTKPCTFLNVVSDLANELRRQKCLFGGVAVTTNQLNYTGIDYSYHLLVVNDLICIKYDKQLILFDINMALKEDYDMTIRQLLARGGVVRCNKYLCDFPHRQNQGGANTYRNTRTELEATKKLKTKWGPLVKDHPTRSGQVALNYKEIEKLRQTVLNHG